MPELPAELERMMTARVPRREAANVGAHWIAGSHPVPEQVWEEWDGPMAVAIVPAGRDWDAVAMPFTRLDAVIADMGPLAWRHCPVLLDIPSRRAYAFVPEGTAGAWSEPGTTALGRDSWLIISKPGGRQSRVAQWRTPPDVLTRLANPVDLSASLRRTATPDEPEEGP
ncbi:hypothetical protein [Streptomyces sp. NPDC059708]|uniref:hypothetical protein n=1 Tax=Streptomyces sp. NPDC059708 TaxID=3346916 RepID=UPI0036AEA45E